MREVGAFVTKVLETDLQLEVSAKKSLVLAGRPSLAVAAARMMVKVSEGGNSGIQYRGHPAPDRGLDIVTGYQCDIVAKNPNYNGMLYEEKGRRILSHTGRRSSSTKVASHGSSAQCR